MEDPQNLMSASFTRFPKVQWETARNNKGELYIRETRERDHGKWRRARAMESITFLCGYSSLCGVVTSLCLVVTSLCLVVTSLCAVVTSLCFEVSSLRLVMQS